MNEIQVLEKAIQELEEKRNILGDSIVDTALESIRTKLGTLSTQPTSKEQLKVVSVLFVDVSGSTRMARSLDPEDLKDILSGALNIFRHIAEKHGGAVERYLGDGFMALFGALISKEDDAEQAVRAGLEMLDAAQSYAGEVKQRWGIAGFNVKVGINTGQVILGGELEDNNLAIGMAINIAQRMQSAAPSGGLLITHSTFRLVRGLFKAQALPPLKVKGRDRPVRAYLVFGVETHPELTERRGVEGVVTPFVGREDELNRIQGYLSHCHQNSETTLITIIGEPGLGKSRLMLEVQKALAPENLILMKGRATPQTERTPFGLLRAIIIDILHIFDGDNSVIVRQKIEEGMRNSLRSEPLMKSHIIGTLLGFDFSRSPYLVGVQQDPKQLRERGLFYLTEFFQTTKERAPIALFLDDLHWGDDPSLDFIESLSKQPNTRLFILCTTRPELLERRPAWGTEYNIPGTRQSRLYLYPLSHHASDLLLNTILHKTEPLPEELRYQIHEHAAGNPFYLEELINNLIDEGILRRKRGQDGWTIEGEKLSKLEVPPTLTALLQSRLDSLPENEKKVLQSASIIGRIFWDEALQVLLKRESPPDTELLTLSDRDLIYPRAVSAFEDMDEYIFKHILMQEVTYESVLKSHRRSSHAQIAHWLEITTGEIERQDEYALTIARHWDQAENKRSAAEWYLRAAIKAKNQGGLTDADEILERALNLVSPEEKDLSWSIYLERSEVHGLLGENDLREKDDQVLLDLALTLADNTRIAEAYYRQGSHFLRKGKDSHSLAKLQLAAEESRKSQNLRLETIITALEVVCLSRLGEMEKAKAFAEKAVSMANEINDDETLARALTNASIYYGTSGDIARAVHYLRQQIVINHRLNNRYGEVIGLINLGYDYIQLGMYKTAQHTLVEALEISKAIGTRRESAYAKLNLGLAYFRNDDLVSAENLLEETVVALQNLGDSFGQASGLTYLALIKEKQGEYASALTTSLKSKQIFTELNVHSYANDALTILARIKYKQNDLEKASEYVIPVYDFLNANGPEGMEFPIWSYVTCARIYLALNEKEKAINAIQKGHQELIKRSERISDIKWRMKFLEKVPEHRTIIRMFQEL
jgi:predicted ATPase/class 3 adenylate cyclase